MLATVWWQVAPVPRLPELKFWLVQTSGLVHRPLSGVVPGQAGH
jgi:hypothetical protein